MPITRRKRANPPDQPENNNSHLADQPENNPETPTPAERAASTSDTPIETEHPVDAAPAAPLRPESAPNQPATPPAPILPPVQHSLPPSLAFANGDRQERIDRAERMERPEYPPIEGGRRTARGELFRRPPQPPPVAPPVPAASLQPPSHEIKLPLGKEPGDTHGDPLHLAYNPGYTGAEAARSALLQRLANESKAGGRARCWNCGSLAIVYDRWSTRSKAFGEVGIAFCEICGVWSVM
ncbi:MAG: hypothetical protein JO031_15015 [Ktedonobacteraceae bacterium]|nr:hypothetical protein [Ktedonobacteraceae bacterium]